MIIICKCIIMLGPDAEPDTDSVEFEQIQITLNETKQTKQNKPSYVYLLVSSKGATYIGATVDLNHRLRQHNKELVGGAYATSAKVNAGETWTRACHVAGFPDWRGALQFEWRWKQISRKIIKTQHGNNTPLERRAEALRLLLLLDRPTSKAILYSEWTKKPQVNVEIDTKIFDKCIIPDSGFRIPDS